MIKLFHCYFIIAILLILCIVISGISYVTLVKGWFIPTEVMTQVENLCLR